MAYIAAVLAIFLFYKFVEKPHKIIFFKFVCVLTALGLLVFGAIFLYDFIKKDSIEKTDLTAEYIYHLSKLDSQKKQNIAIKEFEKFKLEKRYFFSKIPKEYLGYVYWTFASAYTIGDSPYKDLIGENKEELEAFYKTLSGDTIVRENSIKLLEKLEDERYLKYLNNTVNSKLGNQIYAFQIDALMYSLPKRLQQRFFDTVPDNNTKELLKEIKEYRIAYKENMNNALNAENFDSSFAIEFCNKSKKQLNSYSARVSGFQSGRSTENGLREYDSSSTLFEGDLIIPAETCKTVVWTGKYKFFDNYKVNYSYGNWADN
jgi:hypothetical protein